MKTFDSNLLTINRPQSEIFKFLSDFRNFGKLMPSEITNWQADEFACSFTISNMADLNMGFGKSIPHERIIMVSRGKNPFDFDIQIVINDLGNKISETKIVFNADLNPLLASMASSPLTNFINMLVNKLKYVMESRP